MNYSLIILAAGKGSRFYISDPKFSKLMLPILDKPILEFVSDATTNLKFSHKIMVVGFQKEIISEYFKDKFKFVVQEELLGTGHAVAKCSDYLKEFKGYTLILNGDMPTIKEKTLEKILNLSKKNNCSAIIATTILNEPKNYGRIIKKEDNIIAIKEARDCTEEELLIKEVNTGIYLFNNQDLFNFLKYVECNNNQKEYYLTDLVELMVKENKKVITYQIEDSNEILGVNNQKDYYDALTIINKENNYSYMEKGVFIYDINSTFISKKAKLIPPITIFPNSSIIGKSIINQSAFIGPNSEISNSSIGKNSKMEYSIIRDSEIGENSTIGPFAHIRQNTSVGDFVRVGNFVEIKKSTLGNNTKSAHLTYLGDSQIGNNVNIGCGVITANYDGKYKHKTLLQDNSFIGCNTTLIAPISVGKNAYIAAGSTITDDVPEKSLAIARNRQTNKLDYVVKLKKEEET